MFKKKTTMDLVRADRRFEESTPDIPAEEDEPIKVHRERVKKEPRQKPSQKSSRNPHQKLRLTDVFRNKSFIGGICIIAALLIAFVVVPLIQKMVTSETTSVVILNQDVTVGEHVTEDMVTTKEMPTYNLPETTIHNVTNVVGSYVIVPACKGDILTINHLTNEYPGGNPELASLPVGKLAISLSLDTLAQSVSGKLRAGDVIQLYAVFSDNASDNNASEYTAVIIPELQYVEVLSVSDADAVDVTDQSEDVQKISTVTLIVNQAQAKAVTGLEAYATIHAALACRGDEAMKAALLEAQEKFLVTPVIDSTDTDSNNTENEVD